MSSNNAENSNVIVIEQNRFINDEISLGNRDLEATVKLNLAAGNFINHAQEGDDFKNDPSVYQNQLKRQIGIDLAECFELLEAYVLGDSSLLRDALADKRITLNGFQSILPFSLIEDYREAVENNFTRFDISHERALDTQDKYDAIGVKTYITEVTLQDGDQTTTYFANKVKENCTDIHGENYVAGKWVKSKYFNNDNFPAVTGLFVDKDAANEKAAEICERYCQVIDLVNKLTRHLSDIYTKELSTLKSEGKTVEG